MYQILRVINFVIIDEFCVFSVLNFYSFLNMNITSYIQYNLPQSVKNMLFFEYLLFYLRDLNRGNSKLQKNILLKTYIFIELEVEIILSFISS